MTEAPSEINDIFLNPGEYYFGGPNIRIRTLLGSCVSIILWHPLTNVGGMCHYLLANRADKSASTGHEGKYGEDALELFLKSMKSLHSEPKDYVAKVFGGSNMFSKTEKILLDESSFANSKLVGVRNIEFAKEILHKHSIKIVSENTGGNSHRRVFFTIWDGDVWMESQNDV